MPMNRIEIVASSVLLPRMDRAGHGHLLIDDASTCERISVGAIVN
jgi:hypothetical protein